MHRCDIDWLHTQGAGPALIHVASTVNAIADAVDAVTDAILDVPADAAVAVFPGNVVESPALDGYLDDPEHPDDVA